MSPDTFPPGPTRSAAAGYDEGDVARTDDIPFTVLPGQPRV
ncbi:hypothetical protein ACFRAR_27190 [Kitasatospora sp. NPDC056651]